LNEKLTNSTPCKICASYQDFDPPHLPKLAAAPLFDAAALTLFFEDAGSMGLSNRTRLQHAHKGIVVPNDFKEFGKEGYLQSSQTCTSP
jgi:hypothetical protein